MDLTSPGGSDLAQVRTRAVPDGKRYRIFGQKIFITWGDHDITSKHIHGVGAHRRSPGGREGHLLFMWSKWLVTRNGLARRAPMKSAVCRIEHKSNQRAHCVLPRRSERRGGYLVARRMGLDMLS